MWISIDKQWSVDFSTMQVRVRSSEPFKLIPKGKWWHAETEVGKDIILPFRIQKPLTDAYLSWLVETALLGVS